MARLDNIATRCSTMPGMVHLPTGQVMPERQAREAQFQIMSRGEADAVEHKAARDAAVSDVAMRLPGMPGRVRAPGYGTMSDSDARARGFRVMTKAEADAAATQAVKDARVEAFASLPEAHGKTRSAVRLAADYTAAAMPLERARSFLRGAPTDAAIAAARHAPQPSATAPAAPLVTHGDHTMPSTTDADKAKRRAELGNTMRGMQGGRVPVREPAGAPEAPAAPVDREARRAQLSALGKSMLGHR